MKKKILIIGSVLIALIVISAKLMGNKAEVDKRNKTNDLNFKSVTVNIAKALRQEESARFTLVGTTAGKNEVLIQSQGNGEVIKINFSTGDYVTKGKVLAQLDDRLAQLSLEKAKLALSRAEDDYNKEKNLYSGKASTENQLRDKKIDYENAKLSVEQAKKQLEFMRVAAPQNGYIVEKLIEKGSLAGPGSAVARIVDISQLKINLSVSEKDVYSIKTGMSVSASSSVYPGVTYSGKVTFVSSKGDQAHNYSVEVAINNNQLHPLKAGTFTSVEFGMASKHNVLLIPREALTGSIKDAKVFVVNGNIAHLRSVTIGNDYGNFLEVLSGISEGETVVTAGQINLADGSRVVTINN
ncbi:MAG: efflux RND transporter periplasmic adaptor subunit [Ignavibacteria bacterium]|jgi:RND family efflux transporter MFP subunit|nr:efflux RND transporter periplasmic adaptor subunit [Ignavibacteria bacterium]MCU7502940.1 efflux RND transporter periplasmic adaptor subunit [Ignavibacteria bacterium]MCU7517077.1 efflux RND transporter periplasmic adaptor subunit [Ignavibacteria bacterium]